MFGDAIYFARRMFIRTGRIALGFVLALLAIWIAAESLDLLGRPFATASLLTIFGGLALGSLALAVGAFALGAAFGEAPTRKEYEDQLRFEREKISAEERARLAKIESWPLWRQALYDPSFARRNPKYFAAAAAIGLGLVAAAVSLLWLAQ